ncbi:YhbY family RNA-binding protein, partial [Oleiphilus sp. HI0067]
RALEQHELIKVKVASNDREFRAQAMTEMAEKTNATQVQIIGKIVVLLRRSKKPNPKLSNLIRM